MNATIQAEQGLSAADAIEKALEELEKCRTQYTAIYKLAMSRVPNAIALMAARNFTRLEKQWRRDPVNYCDAFAAHHLGAAHIAGIWEALAGSLEDDSQSPTFELILDCVRAEGSSIDFQNLNEMGHFLMKRFLIMQESPEYAIKKWLKILKCDDPEQIGRGLEKFIEPNTASCACRLGLLEMAWKKSTEWQNRAKLALQQFNEYSKTLQNSPIPACQTDSTLGASLREARSLLNAAEKRYQKLLKQHEQKDLAQNPKAQASARPTPPQVQQPPHDKETPQKSAPLVQPNLARIVQPNPASPIQPNPAARVQQTSAAPVQPKPVIQPQPLLQKQSTAQQNRAVVKSQLPNNKPRRQDPMTAIQAAKSRRKSNGPRPQDATEVLSVQEFSEIIDLMMLPHLTG